MSYDSADDPTILQWPDGTVDIHNLEETLQCYPDSELHERVTWKQHVRTSPYGVDWPTYENRTRVSTVKNLREMYRRVTGNQFMYNPYHNHGIHSIPIVLINPKTGEAFFVDGGC